MATILPSSIATIRAVGTVCPVDAKREVDLHCIESQDDLVRPR